MNFYSRMIARLSDKGVTQADMCRELSMSKSVCTHYRDGSIPSADVAVRIADYLGCTVEYLMTGKELDLDPESLSLLNRIKALNPDLKTILLHNLESFEEIQKKIDEKKN